MKQQNNKKYKIIWWKIKVMLSCFSAFHVLRFFLRFKYCCGLLLFSSVFAMSRKAVWCLVNTRGQMFVSFLLKADFRCWNSNISVIFFSYVCWGKWDIRLEFSHFSAWKVLAISKETTNIFMTLSSALNYKK